MNRTKRKTRTKKTKKSVIILEIIIALLLTPIVLGSPYLIIAGLLAIDVFVLVPMESISTEIVQDIEQYEKDRLDLKNAAKYMPSLDSLSDYNNLKYAHKERVYSFFMGFVSDGLSLFLSYDETIYEGKREEVLSSYTFLEEPIKDGDDYEIPVTEFEYKGYDMRVVPDEEYVDYAACKSFTLVGCNDDLNAIVYMYFYDFDIDYIAAEGEDPVEEMTTLIEDAFYWYDM